MEGLQVTNFDQCLHIVTVIGKCIDRFQGNFSWIGRGLRRGGYMGGFPWRKFVMGGENFHEGGGGAGFSNII